MEVVAGVGNLHTQLQSTFGGRDSLTTITTGIELACEGWLSATYWWNAEDDAIGSMKTSSQHYSSAATLWVPRKTSHCAQICNLLMSLITTLHGSLAAFRVIRYHMSIIVLEFWDSSFMGSTRGCMLCTFWQTCANDHSFYLFVESSFGERDHRVGDL